MLERDGPVQVLIVASSAVVQAGLEAMVAPEPDIEVMGFGATIAALGEAAAQASDAVILDGGLAAHMPLEKLAALVGDSAIALLVDEGPISPFLQAGVRGLLPQDVSAEALVLAVKAIAGGLTVLHPEVAEDWLQAMPVGPLPVPQAAPLTPRELEVLQGLATGMANKAIARQLNISEHTVKFHVSSIFSKLSASSRTEAVTTAMRQGLVFM